MQEWVFCESYKTGCHTRNEAIWSTLFHQNIIAKKNNVPLKRGFVYCFLRFYSSCATVTVVVGRVIHEHLPQCVYFSAFYKIVTSPFEYSFVSIIYSFKVFSILESGITQIRATPK
jgi:hypothetical protein